jgi:hypothetical protein
MELLKTTYVVMVLGYYGIADTVKEAAEKCKDAGALKTEDAIVFLVINPEKPVQVDNSGAIHWKSEYDLIRIAKFIKLSVLLKLKG